MRILGFSKVDWRNYITGQDSKMLQPEFTTWRWPRKDKDWGIGEVVSAVVRPRSPHRLILGEAVIVTIEGKDKYAITDDEARADGFDYGWKLTSYLDRERYARKIDYATNVHKITLRWLSWLPPMICFGTQGWGARRDYPSLFGNFKPPKAGSNA